MRNEVGGCCLRGWVPPSLFAIWYFVGGWEVEGANGREREREERGAGRTAAKHKCDKRKRARHQLRLNVYCLRRLPPNEPQRFVQAAYRRQSLFAFFL